MDTEAGPVLMGHSKQFGPLVDAAPARKNIQPMTSIGVTASHIHRLTGVSPHLVKEISAGRETARRWHVDALASLSMQAVIDSDPLVHVGDLPERITNASRAGWTHEHIAGLAGVGGSTVSGLAAGNSKRSRLSLVEALRAALTEVEARGYRADVKLRAGCFTDAEPAREHAHQLIAYGIGVADIARVSGVDYATVYALVTGAFRSIKQVNAEAILGTSITAIARSNPHVDIGGVRHQVRDLNRRGWSQGWIAEQLGLHQSTISAWQTGRIHKARLRTVLRFQSLFNQLDGSSGPHSRSAGVLEAKRPHMLERRAERERARKESKIRSAAA